MSLKIDRTMHPLNTVIQNTKSKNKVLTATRTSTSPPAQDLVPTPEINYEEIELLVEELKTFAAEKTQNGFGFRPTPKDKNEVRLGFRAKELANLLLDNPKPANIKTAKKFLKLIELIYVLEEKARERNKFGFKNSKETNGNTILAQRASQIATLLKGSDNKALIKEAAGFLGLLDLIENMENIAADKSKSTYGFHPTNTVNKDHETIAIMANALAEKLKVDPSNENIQTVIAFITIVNQYDELEAAKELQPSKDHCYGFHCSMDSEPQYAQAA